MCFRCMGLITGEQPVERQLGAATSLRVTEQTGIMVQSQHQTVDFESELRRVRIRTEVTHFDRHPAC